MKIRYREPETKMKNILIAFLTITTFGCQNLTKSESLEYRSVEYYFDQVAELETNELINQRVLLDTDKIADNYLDPETGKFNREGAMKIYGSQYDFAPPVTKILPMSYIVALPFIEYALFERLPFDVALPSPAVSK